MPSRAEILQGLNAVKKITLPPTEDSRPSTSGLVGQAGGVLRVRDRVTIQANAPAAPPAPIETTEQRMARLFAEGQRNREAREAAEAKRRQEQRAARERERIRKIEDEKCLKEMADRRDKQIADNFIRAEIKGIVQANDLNDAELTQVVALLKEWRTEKLLFAWQTAIDTVRANQSK